MKKLLFQGVTSDLFRITLPIDRDSNWIMFYSVESRDSVNHKVTNLTGVHFGFASLVNATYRGSLVNHYQDQVSTDGLLTFTISQTVAGNYATISVLPSQATFTPSSITIYFHVLNLNNNSIQFL